MSKKDVEASLSDWLTGFRANDGKRLERAWKAAVKQSASGSNLSNAMEA